ncbi:hypothetical protein CAPTEDRAFT_209864 [Capitella teleta]|uniref:Major facilitator superfamily (MFS) profile domain-containing protein n=1 Tax=Capitella teleta TaxID=283909 RepID=R7UWV8_CAPTE|nr:hypothetical protein CAPTEDRAFT_209864 [Capitella teleta]|eukprot:ELU07896.1 hypothetical protein CAPTEDRAFT_209864 [Capitella teleta]
MTDCESANPPVSSFLAERIGIRWTTIIGALLSFCGLFATTFAPNIYVAFITLGIITGMGFGIIFSMGTVAIALHFDRFRPVAFAVSQSGIHIGSFVYPFLGEWLLEGYGYEDGLYNTHTFDIARKELFSRVARCHGNTTIRSLDYH